MKNDKVRDCVEAVFDAAARAMTCEHGDTVSDENICICVDCGSVRLHRPLHPQMPIGKWICAPLFAAIIYAARDAAKAAGVHFNEAAWRKKNAGAAQ